MKKIAFGTKGIWHMPESENSKAKDVPAIVLEDNNGLLFIFTEKPIRKGWKNLTYRTATIFSSDFTVTEVALYVRYDPIKK